MFRLRNKKNNSLVHTVLLIKGLQSRAVISVLIEIHYYGIMWMNNSEDPD